MTVMPGVGFGYPCSTYVPCLFAFRASEEEETEMPSAQTSSPSRIDVLSMLAMTMEFLHRFLSAPGNSGAFCRRSQPNLAQWVAPGRTLEQCPRAGKSKRSDPFHVVSGSKVLLY